MGCIRVPITAITAVVEAKMHPPLLSCAYFANQSLWFIFGHRLFLYPTILHSDGKDTAMKSETKKRKSGFNPNRGYYFTADGKNYCYERWDDENKCIITQKLEIGKDLSLELPIMLDESDHDEMNLQNRYEDEQFDSLFDTKVANYKANNSMGRDDYREERVKRAVKKYGKTLWHYTDINALCGIIGKKEIWFGSAEHMNDREELIGFINDLEKEVYACIDSANKEKPMMFWANQR